MKRLSKGRLIEIGDILAERLKSESKNIYELPLRDYYEFKKYTVDPEWYKDLADPSYLLVEIAMVIGPHPEAHYHSESHAYNVILGPEHGVNECPYGSTVSAGRGILRAYSGFKIYFPKGLPHSFSAPPREKFLFLSIQNPPLERGDGTSDYHYV